MSTFKGIVPEVPGIRVDFFRHQADFPPPLACFLSHVHSDHLAGLETFDGCFIYCSAATKEILLRLEKKSVRLNYAKGILEDPRQQTYRHLEKKLKPLPLDTPTSIQLAPGRTIQVTLLDANHCVGAVMFLFEAFGKAVLYTGDIRCEPRFVTAIIQNPNMIEYSFGSKTLDRIYLDTSVLDDYKVPSKAEGLRELLEKLKQYPPDTIFYFQSWTYGSLDRVIKSAELEGMAVPQLHDSYLTQSQIHVDDYKMRIFQSLVTKSKDNRWATQTHLAKEAPALVGFTCGNSLHGGCLTRDENVRIHSCEKGMGCSVMASKPIVWIRPIVTHLKDGRDVMEVGIGGGGEDLAQASMLTPEDILEILQLMSVNNRLPEELHAVMHMLQKTLSSGRDISLIAEFDGTTEDTIAQLLKSLLQKFDAIRNPTKERDDINTSDKLPNVINFPYARHSSLSELREFTRAFKARDITPCTFDADLWLQKGWSIDGLFGDCCSGDTFQYDAILDHRSKELAALQRDAGQDQGSQHTASSGPCESSPFGKPTGSSHKSDTPKPMPPTSTETRIDMQREPGAILLEQLPDDQYELDSDSSYLQVDSQASILSNRAYATRQMAFDAAIGNIDGSTWDTIELISTTDNHTCLDEELGHVEPPQETIRADLPDLSAL